MTDPILTAAQVRAELARRCEYPRTQTAAARELGVSLSYFNAALHGDCEPAGKLLDALGFERVVMYRRAGDRVAA